MSTETPTQMQWELRRYRQRPSGGPRSPKRPRGRWIWTISGVLVTGAIGVPIALTLVRAGTPSVPPFDEQPSVHDITISKAVTGVNVQSYGADVRVIGGAATKNVRVIETVNYDPTQEPAPSVVHTVSHGLLTLAAPDCTQMTCSVGFTLMVPSDVSVTAVTGGGNVDVAGVASANLDSGGGDVTATSVSGALTVTTENGNQYLTGIGGSLQAESGGGDVTALGITGPTVTISTDGGQLSAVGVSATAAILSSGGSDARVAFTTAPDAAIVTTDGGNATVLLPGGPYALTANSAGGPGDGPGDAGPETVGIATNPTARNAVTITTGGGDLVVEPTSESGQAGHPSASVTTGSVTPRSGNVPPIPPVPPAP